MNLLNRVVCSDHFHELCLERDIRSELSKEWVAKEIKVKKLHSFVTKLFVKSESSRKEKGAKIDCKAAQLLGRLVAPKTIAYTEKPPKEHIHTLKNKRKYK